MQAQDAPETLRQLLLLSTLMQEEPRLPAAANWADSTQPRIASEAQSVHGHSWHLCRLGGRPGHSKQMNLQLTFLDFSPFLPVFGTL